MAVGAQPTTSDINSNAGNITRQLNILMTEIQQFQTWLLATPDATLTSPPYSMAQADVTTLKSAFTDLNKLAGIYTGTQTQATTYDFRTFAKQVYGFGF